MNLVVMIQSTPPNERKAYWLESEVKYMSDFLHGVETQRQKADSQVSEVDTSIVCVVGTAPIFNLKQENQTINSPQPIRDYTDIALYAGDDIEGFTLPDALKTILDESGGAKIYMINVFDPEKHVKTVEKVAPLTNNKAVLEDKVVSLTVTGSGDTTYVEGTDYKFENNTIEALSDTFKALDSVNVSYTTPDVTTLTNSAFVGEVDEDGNRTGVQVIENIQAMYGDRVGIVIVPEYSAEKVIRNAVEQLSDELKFYFYPDAPKGLSVNKAIQARNEAVDNVDLTTTNKRSTMCATWVKRYSAFRDKTEVRPLSPVVAGLRVMLDNTRNIAKSIDNTKSKTILGTEIPITFKLNKANTDSNALNAVGLTTVINHKGAYYIWGGRNCAFPSESGIETFEHVSRTADFIEESIQDSSFECVGENITQGFIKNVLGKINSFLDKYKNPENQLLLDGKAWYDEASQTAEDQANGFIVFDYEMYIPSVVERMCYRSRIRVKVVSNQAA